VLTLTTGSEVIYPGKYTLSLPVKSYTLDGALNTTASSFEYTVAERTELSYSSSVVSGSIFSASSFKGITLTFNDAATLNDGKYEASIQVWDADTEEWGEDYDAQFFQEAFTDGDKVFTFIPRETKTPANGKYRLYVPATVFLTADGEKANREISIEFTIADAPAVTINPAAGEVESLETFSLTFADATAAAFNYSAFSNRLFPTVAGTNGTAATSSMLGSGYSAEGNVLTFKVGKLESAGTYTLTVPGQSYTLDGKDGVTLTFDYTIKASQKALEYTITPEADADGNVSTISPIVVTFPNATKVEDNPNANFYTQYAYVEYNSPKAGWGEEPAEIKLQSNSILFFPEDKNPGEFKLTIPAGTYLVDGLENPEIVKTFNYVEPVQDAVVVSPAAGTVEGLQSFTIEFPNATTVETSISHDAYPVLYNVGEDHGEYSFQSATVDGNKMTLTTSAAITAVGTYELRIPGGCYTVDGAAGTDITVAYTIGASTKTFEYTVTPADGSTITSFSSVVVKFTNANTITLNDEFGEYPVIEEYVEDDEDWFEVDGFDNSISGNELVLTRKSSYPALPSGKYRLVVPSSLVVVDGQKYTEKITSAFTLEQAVPEFSTVIDPEQGNVSSLKEFNISFKNIDTVGVNNYTADTRYYIVDSKDNKTYSTESFVNADAEGSPLYIAFNEITTPGTYKLVLPANSYKVNGYLGDKELTYTYTIVAADYATVTPAAGEYTSLQEFKVTINNATTVEFNVDAFSNGKLPKLVGINGTTASGSMAASGYSAEGNVLTFKIGYSEFNTVGEYELQIPGECFTVDGEAGKDITYGTYKIIASANTFEYSISPEDGETITSFSSVVVKFPNAASISIDEDAEEPVTLETYNAEYFDWDIVDTQASASGNELVITVPSYVSLASGKYNLTINANYISVDGQKFTEKIESSFTLEQAVPEFSTVIDPAEGTVSSLKEFNIIFKDVDTFVPNNYADATKYYIVDSEENKTYSTESFVNEDAEGSPLYIAFNEITTPGTYKLVLPANSYKVNGILGNELTYTYTIAAAVDKTAYTVTINGEELKDGAELTEYSTITVTFPNATELSYDENDWTYYPMVQSWDESWQEWGDAYGMTAIIDGNSISFDVESWVGKLEGGTYRVYIPANNFSIDGESLAADIVVNFTIKQVVPEFTAISDPTDGSKVVSLSIINIFFDGISTLGKGYDATPYILDANNIKTSADAYQVTAIFSDDDNFKYALHFELDSEITEEGTYTLVLPAGSYIVDGVKGDKDLSFTYTVDKNAAVSAIFVDGVQNVDVYDLRGIRVLKNATPAQVRNLDTNIYIINGQKIRLRK
jgi:hypothetical protein